MEWISVNDRLPEHDQFVLIYLPDVPWIDEESEGKHLMVVAVFRQGVENPIGVIRGCDQWGNNERPYCWEEFGPSSWNGQEVSHWAELPEVPNATE